MAARTFIAFRDWKAVLSWVDAHGHAYYHPPLNVSPAFVDAEVRGDSIRVKPVFSDGDPFTADEEHFDRFKHPNVCACGRA